MVKNFIKPNKNLFRKQGKKGKAEGKSYIKGLIRICVVSFFVLSLAFLMPQASAANKYWDGGGTTNNWSDAANWNNDSLPSVTDDIFFDGTSAKDITINTAVSVKSIKFDSAYKGHITIQANIAVTTFQVGKDISLTTTTAFSLSVAGNFINAGVTDLSYANPVTLGGLSSTGTLKAPSGSMTITGTVGIYGPFDANYGAVYLNASGTSQQIYGKTITFYSLYFLKPGVTITFISSDAKIRVNGMAYMQGTAGNEIKLRAGSTAGFFYFDPAGAINIAYVDVQNSKNLRATPINPANSINSGRTVNWWSLPATSEVKWTGSGSDANWSTAANWSTNQVPDSTKDVVFDSGNKPSTIDSSFSNHIASLTINGYAGTISQSNDLTVDRVFKEKSGAVTKTGDYTLTVAGNFYQSGGSLGASGNNLKIDLTGVDAEVTGNFTYTDLTVLDRYRAITNLTINKLAVTGTTIESELNMNGFGLEVLNGTEIGNASAQRGNLLNEYLGDMTLRGGVTVYDSIFTSGNLTMYGDIWSDGAIEVYGGKDINIYGNVIQSSDIADYQGGDINIYGNANFDYDIWTDGGGDIYIQGDATALDGGNLWTMLGKGDITIDGDLTTNENGCAVWTDSGGNIDIKGDVNITYGDLWTEDGGDLRIRGSYTGTTRAELWTQFGNLRVDGPVDISDNSKLYIESGSMSINNSITSSASLVESKLDGSITVLGTFSNGVGSSLTGKYGDWSFSDVANSGTITLPTGVWTHGTITGAGSVVSPPSVNNASFGDGTDVNLSDGNYYEATQNLNLNSLTIASGTTLNMKGYSLQVAGSSTVHGNLWSSEGDIILEGALTGSGNVWVEGDGSMELGSVPNSGNWLNIWEEGSGYLTVDGDVAGVMRMATVSGNIQIWGNYDANELWSEQGEITVSGIVTQDAGDYIGTRGSNINLGSIAGKRNYDSKTYGLVFIKGDGEIFVDGDVENGVDRYDDWGGVFVRGNGNIDIAGDVTNGSGFLYVNGSGLLQIEGSLNNNAQYENYMQASVFTKNGGDIQVDGDTSNTYAILDSSGDLKINATTNTGGALEAENMIVNGAVNNSDKGQFRGGSAQVNGNFSNVSQGWLVGKEGSFFDFNGDFINDATSTVVAPENWNLSGDFTNSNSGEYLTSGSGFYHNNGTVTLDNWNQTINGSTVFHNLTSTQPSGENSSFGLTTSLDVEMDGSTTEVYNGYVYVLGGYDDTNDLTVDTVRHAKINEDGSLGTWVVDDNKLNTPRAYHSSAAYNGYLYITGGGNDDEWDFTTVEYAKINADGSVGPWVISPNSTLGALSYGVSIAHNDFLYLVGGWDGNAGFDSNQVEIAPINADGSIGEFSFADNTMLNGREEHVAYIVNDRLYVTGGYGDDNYTDTEYADINPDGTLGTWAADPNELPRPVTYSTVATVGNKVFLIGGQDEDTRESLDTVYYTTVNSDGSINAWNLLETKLNYPRFDAWTGTNGEYIYVVGGAYRLDGDWTTYYPQEVDYIRVLDTGGPLENPDPGQVITNKGNITVDSLQTYDNFTNNAGVIKPGNGGSFSIGGDLRNNNSGVLYLDDYSLVVQGDVWQDSSSAIVNADDITIVNDLNLQGTMFNNTGSISVGGTTTLENSGTLMNNASGQTNYLHNVFSNDGFLNLNDNNLEVTGDFDNLGSAYLNANDINISGDLNNESDVHGTTLTVGGGVTVNNGDFTIKGAINISGNLAADGGFFDTTISGSTRGDIIVGGNAVLDGDTEIFPNNLNITGSLTGSRLYVQTYESVYVEGLAYIHGQMFIDKDLEVGGALTVDKYGEDSLEYGFVRAANITVDGNTTITNGSYIGADNATFNQDVDLNTGSFLIPKSLTVVGNLVNQTGSHINGTTGNWSFQGDFTNSSSSVLATEDTWNIAGDFSNNVTNTDNLTEPYFSNNEGTIRFSGSEPSNIVGSTTFYNFSAIPGKSLVFEATSTQNIEGDLNLIGTNDNLITITSSNSPNRAEINPTGTLHVSYVDVSDNSNISSVFDYINPASSFDSGNTLRWFEEGVVHTITSSAGSGGTISPLGVISVLDGSSQTYAITPSSGYAVDDVLVDGSSVGEIASYEFLNIVTEHTISVTFKATVPHYSIVASAGTYGSINPSGTTSISEGNNLSFVISPNTGYHIEDVLVDDSSVGAVSSYTFSNITANHTISATFAHNDEPVVPPVVPPVIPPVTPVEKNYANIIIIESEKGSIAPNTLDTKIEEGKTYTFIVTPNSGYELGDIYDNGTSILNDKCGFADNVVTCTITIGEEVVLGNPFITTHEISASYKEIPEETSTKTTEPANESNDDSSTTGFFAGITQGTKEISIAVATAFIDVVKQTPPPVAYTFPWLLFVLLAYLMYRLAKQARQEGESANKLVRLVEFDKNVGIQKDNFIMLSSHYLRTPLTIITAGIDLLFTLEKTTEEKSGLVKRALAGLNTKVESIFQEISANKYLQTIDATNVKEEKIKIYSSPFLWLPIILIGGIAVLADFLFIKVANININLINLLTEMVAFIIIAQFFISFFRKRQNERKKNLKERTELKKQQVLDDARNKFMKEIVETLGADVAALEVALAQTGSDKNKKEINKGIGDLKQMIRKFGFLATLEAGKARFDYRDVSIGGAFSDFVKAKDEEIKAKNLKIDMPSNDLNLKSDPEKLTFVIEGLLDNAIKFSKEGGQIDVNYQETHKGIEISVSDNGVGMTDEAKELLFKPFTRGTSTLQFDYEGMGTNLYIAKMITNYLGGDITVESKIGKGTKVRVLIEDK